MVARNYGRIVNVASIAGKEGNPNASAYSASKAGVIALTKSLGKEVAGHDVAVNAITPAAAKTKIFDQMSQQHIDYMLSKIPRGRFVTVEEIASMMAWLVSAETRSRPARCSTSRVAAPRTDASRCCRSARMRRALMAALHAGPKEVAALARGVYRAPLRPCTGEP